MYSSVCKVPTLHGADILTKLWACWDLTRSIRIEMGLTHFADAALRFFIQLSKLEEENSDLQHTVKETKLELEEAKSNNDTFRDKLRKARDKHILLQDDYDKLQEEMEEVGGHTVTTV